MILTWLILAPVGLYFGTPRLVDYAQTKARDENYARCITETKSYQQTFDPARPEIADNYCHCVIEGIVLTKDDLITMLRREPNDRLSSAVQDQVTKCNYKLEHPDPKAAQVLYF